MLATCFLLIVASIAHASSTPLLARIQTQDDVYKLTLVKDETTGKYQLTETITSSTAYDVISVHENPPMFGRHLSPDEVCAKGVGAKMMDLTAQTLAGAQEKDLFHRSVVVTSTKNKDLKPICGVLLPDGKVETYRAKFIGPVVGTVWLRSYGSLGTFVLGKLTFGDGRSTSQNMSMMMYRDGEIFDQHFASRCQDLRSPVTVSESIEVQSSVKTDGVFAFVLDIVSVGGSLAVTDDGMKIACAKIRKVPPKTAIGPLNWNSVKGQFVFKQDSPFDHTEISIELTGLKERAVGYGIHEFPVPQRLSATENPYERDYVGSVFNPYNSDIALGALSKRSKDLKSMTLVDFKYKDSEITMWGPNGISGRSIVIYVSSGSPLVCGNIDYPTRVITGVVTFKSPAYGMMYFRQDASNPDEDTTVFIELANQDKVMTTDHNWHVHVAPVNGDAYKEEGRCASAGQGYNPSGINVTDPPYKSECRVQDPLRCELSDLTGRLGKINIASAWRKDGDKYFFTDEYLHLSGPFSILGRSVVVHVASAGVARYACANITQLHPVVAETGQWKGTWNGSVSGTLILEQTMEFDPVKVAGSFSGLNGLASGYHIHEYTISASADFGSECEAASVGGHYNPFNWTGPNIPVIGTYDQYEVGDLSNKYGLLDGQNSYTLPSDIADVNLPLFTSLASGDKSVVIHKKAGGERWKCSNLMTLPAPGSNGYVITATVSFMHELFGTIRLRQVVYEDGGSGNTHIEVDVSQRWRSTSPQHNWHVHIEPVMRENQCANAKGHYDPYGSIDNKDYATDCNPKNPLHCEVGDLSKKQAKYNIGGGRRAFQDIDVPLHTDYTVLGRSIVFHVSNGGADRLACANIIPDDYGYTISFPITIRFDRYWFTKTVADALGISRSRVVIVHNVDVPIVKYGCERVMVHIVGGGSIPRNLLYHLSVGTLPGLGPYSSTRMCRSHEGLSGIAEPSEMNYKIHPDAYREYYRRNLQHRYGSVENYVRYLRSTNPYALDIAGPCRIILGHFVCPEYY